MIWFCLSNYQHNNFKSIIIIRKLPYQSSVANSRDMVQLITEEEFGAFICSESFGCETINYGIRVSMLYKTDLLVLLKFIARKGSIRMSHLKIIYIKFHKFTVVRFRTMTFWVMTLCSLIGGQNNCRRIKNLLPPSSCLVCRIYMV